MTFYFNVCNNKKENEHFSTIKSSLQLIADLQRNEAEIN